MIVDIHTHIWEDPQQLGGDIAARIAARRPLYHSASGHSPIPDAGPERHLVACEPVDFAVVMGFRSHYLDAHIPNDLVNGYVRQNPDKLIGFAGIDPAEPDEALDEILRARNDLGMKGLTIAPAAQDFHPMHSHALKIYQQAARLGLPILFHQGLYFCPASKMEYARPALLDDVARDFPDLKIIVAHLGYPWVDETIVLIGKHANVYADISGLLLRPWQAYNALLTAYQFGVIDKLLFGSAFPYNHAAACIESLYSINHICHGTSLPTLPREKLRRIVERDTLALLGIDSHRTPVAAAPALIDTDDI